MAEDRGGGGRTPLMVRIADAVIGEGEALDGPYGARRLTYADYTASGRSLDFIEDLLREAVLPWYANTHTEASGTGLQTTRLREDAREIIRDAVGGDDTTAIIFCGSGSTAAIDKLVGILGLRVPPALDERHRLTRAIPADERPVVFVGPYEHHSNELAWRESLADVVRIPGDDDGHVDLGVLESQLLAYAGRPLRIGSFSAASNVTGILTDADAVSELLHRHGALAFWDYAAAAPYLDISMNPADPALRKDAVFLSPHKFVGGPGTPGVLVVRRELVRNHVPVVPGGGAVEYVSPTEHVYIDDVEHREEAGTPAIVEAIRAGLVFQLKQAVGVDAIRAREAELVDRALTRWGREAGIQILGNRTAERLAIVSFLVRSAAPGTGGRRLLHHNFVVALLNDLFGVQARGGCSCAGPYGHTLLGIGEDQSHAFERLLLDGIEGIKPGWVRLNFNYFFPDDVADYLLAAVELIARDGWRLLPDYLFDVSTGLWRHRGRSAQPLLRLHDIGYDDEGHLTFPRREREARLDTTALHDHLAAAAGIMAAADTPEQVCATTARVSEEFDALLWFELPAACLARPAAGRGDDAGGDRGTVGPWPTLRFSSPASASSSPTTRSWAAEPSGC